MEETFRKPKTRFLNVKCIACGNNQVIFGSPSTVVRCTACEKTLAEPKGGKGKILTKIVSVLE